MSTAWATKFSGADGCCRRACATAPRMAMGPLLAALALVLAAAILLLPPMQAHAADTPLELQDVRVQTLPGNRVELELVLSGSAPQPLSFTMDNPARISLDLPGTAIALPSRRREINAGPLSTLLAGESDGRTRVVLNLDTMVPYETRVSGNSVFVTLGTSRGAPASFSGTPAAAPPRAATASAAPRIDSVDFRRGENGAGRVIVQLSDAGIPVDVKKEAGRTVLLFAGADLPDQLLKRLDVKDFATPVETIDVTRAGADTRIVIAAGGAYEELAYQSDQTFTVEIQPVVKTEAAKPSNLFSSDKEYVGERLTLNFQDIETRAVLQLLADVSGRNIVVADTVQGNVTLRLQSVPWDQALDILLATKGLDKRENGNVMIVAPASEIAAREKADLEARKEIVELEPLVSEVLQVNYAKASDLAELIRGKAKNSLLSSRGSVGLDDRTNTLLVQDVVGRIADIRRLVASLDIPVRQVLIESRVVVVRDNFSRDLGVRWGVTAVEDHGSALLGVSGNANGTNELISSTPPEGVALDDRFNVNLPVANPAGSLAVALLNEDFLVDLELSALQAEGRGEVISSPRVITANQKEASIRQGVEIPYQESSSSGATTTEFKEAVLSLIVKPQITPDDRIIMDLKVTKDSVGEYITTERGGQVPSIDTRTVETQVLVNNGQTVVLGGIYETEEGEDFTKVPLLGDIPLLGHLFRSTHRVSDKSELLVFVTPKILKEGSTIN